MDNSFQAIARILRSEGNPVGAGFLVSNNLVITCAHVITAALGLPEIHREIPTEKVTIEFPLIDKNREFLSKVVFWLPVSRKASGIDDIAILEIQENLPKEAKPIKLINKSNLVGVDFKAYGFPKGYPDGVWAFGTIREKISNGWIQLNSSGDGFAISPGFSASPLLNEDAGGAVGMMITRDKDRNIAFGVPSDTMIGIIDNLKKSSSRSIDDDNTTDDESSEDDENDIEDNFEGSDLVEVKRYFSVNDKDGIMPVINAKELAVELSSLISNVRNEQGMILGIFGHWGRGKTFLIEQIWSYLEVKNLFYRVDFHAWKYQDTPASWAYLYENIAAKYYSYPKNNKVLRRLFRIVNLNVKRIGYWPLIAFLAPLIASIVWKFFINLNLKIQILGLLFAILLSIGFSSVIAIILMYFRYKPKALDLFKTYTQKQSLQEFLGIQSEIQNELKLLLRTWIPEKDNRRLLLFVDDLDRCSEDRIIQIIDSLRVMLEENEIYQRVVVIVAVDDAVLTRAIKWKYWHLFQFEEKEEKERQLNKLAQEYMDKLFLVGVKLANLDKEERKEIFEAYTKGRGKVQPSPSINGDFASQDTNIQSASFTHENSTEVSEHTQEKEDNQQDPKTRTTTSQPSSPDTDSRNTDKEKYEITEWEYDLLTETISIKLNASTPRQIRIFYYRYLLARNLLNTLSPQGLSERSRFKILSELIAEHSTSKVHQSQDEERFLSSLEGHNQRLNPEILQAMLNVVKIVAAY